MSENARKISEMVGYLPDEGQKIVLNLVEYLLPDNIATPDDLAAIEESRQEYEHGELLFDDEIDWDNLDKMDLD